LESVQQQLAAFELACHEAGLKATHQRLEIFRELITTKDHPTADMLYQRLRTRLPTISLDTVYRTLSTLTDHGLINRVETAESLARFEASSVQHHHIICRKCGRIMDFVWSLIDEVPLPDEIKDWGRIDHRSLVVYGTCNGCLK
jgi:Fur family peroxide stress response transcriptional regulator